MFNDQIRAVLGLNTTGFSRGINKAKTKVKGLGRTINSTLGMFGGGFVLASFIGSLTRMTSELERTSKKLGMSTDFLQSMRYAADQSEINVNGVSMALQRFSRRSAEAARGQGELAAIFQEANIPLKNTDGTLRSTTDVLKDYADMIQRTESPQERLRLAFKAFDSEGADLVAILKDGSKGLEEWEKKAEAAGVITEEVTIKAINKLKSRMSELSNVIMTQVANAFGHVDKWTKNAGSFWGAYFGGADVQESLKMVDEVSKVMEEQNRLKEEGLSLQEAHNQSLEQNIKLADQLQTMEAKRAELKKALEQARDDAATKFTMEQLREMDSPANARVIARAIANERRQIAITDREGIRAGGANTNRGRTLIGMAVARERRLEQFIEQNQGVIDLIRSISGARAVEQMRNAGRAAAAQGNTDLARRLANRAEDLQGSLPSVVSNERNPFSQLNRLEKIEKDMASVSAAISSTLNVNVENAE